MFLDEKPRSIGRVDRSARERVTGKSYGKVGYFTFTTRRTSRRSITNTRSAHHARVFPRRSRLPPLRALQAREGARLPPKRVRPRERGSEPQGSDGADGDSTRPARKRIRGGRDVAFARGHDAEDAQGVRRRARGRLHRRAAPSRVLRQQGCREDEPARPRCVDPTRNEYPKKYLLSRLHLLAKKAAFAFAFAFARPDDPDLAPSDRRLSPVTSPSRPPPQRRPTAATSCTASTRSTSPPRASPSTCASAPSSGTSSRS